MWLIDYITKNSISGPQGEKGNIKSFTDSKAQVNASSDYKQLPVVVPYGVAYVPATDCETAVVPVSGGEVCLGVIDDYKSNLQPGEVMLYSAGGASLVLKNDGCVYVNGIQVGI